MSSEPDHLTQICESTFWGREYDTDLLNALEALDNAERIARSGEEGEAPHELYSYDAVLHLQAPKSRVAAIRERLESEHGAREASRIIERHYHRIEEMRKSDEFSLPGDFCDHSPNRMAPPCRRREVTYSVASRGPDRIAESLRSFFQRHHQRREEEASK